MQNFLKYFTFILLKLASQFLPTPGIKPRFSPTGPENDALTTISYKNEVSNLPNYPFL